MDVEPSFDRRLVDYYLRRWLDLSAYMTCFHSTDYYMSRSSPAGSSSASELYACYSFGKSRFIFY
jgi:hypothetical protein